MGLKFKIGDEVMIHPDSDYYGEDGDYNPADVVGIVIPPDYNDSVFCYRVQWPRGENNYREVDLMFAKALTKEEMLGW